MPGRIKRLLRFSPATRPYLRVGMVLFGLLLTSPLAFSQIVNDGSIYSRFGLGEQTTVTNSRSQAMGGGGLAVSSTDYLNVENPAALSNQLFTRFTAGFQYQGNYMKDADGGSNHLTTGFLNGVQFGFPILDRKLGVGLSFQPATRVGYRIVSENVIDGAFNEPETPYNVSYEGGGGLYRFDFGVGLNVGSSLSIGAGVRVLTGNIESIQRTTFEDVSYLQTVVREGTRIYGTGVQFGLYYEVPNENPDQLLAFAATFSTPVSLTARRVRTIGESLNVDSLGVPTAGTIDYPSTAALGVVYKPNSRWYFLADARYEPWGSFNSDLSFGGFRPNDPAAQYTDRWRFSAGAEVRPGGSDRLTSFRQRVSYRLGAYFDQAYFEPRPGVSLQTTGLTGGLSFPTRTAGNIIDLNFETGLRGTTDQNLVRDLFYKATVTLNFGERWFVRPKIR